MDPSLLGRPIPTPTAQKPASAFPTRLVVMVAIFVAAIVTGTLLLASSSDNNGLLMQRLSARQATTLKLIQDGQKNLTSDSLSKINSELHLTLLSDNTGLQAELTKAGITKIDKTVTADEADESAFEKLSSAKLNGQYDEVYRTTLTQKLESLQAILQELHDKTKPASLKTALSTEHAHVATYIDELEKLTN